MPSAATASLLSRCQNKGMRIALAVATLLLASPASAQDEFAPVREVIQTCAACHGENGASKVPENPILAGQQYYYLYLQLKDFKSGARASEIMGPLVQPLQPEQMKLLAQFFSKQKWPAIGHAAEGANVDIARRADRFRRVHRVPPGRFSRQQRRATSGRSTPRVPEAYDARFQESRYVTTHRTRPRCSPPSVSRRSRASRTISPRSRCTRARRARRFRERQDIDDLRMAARRRVIACSLSASILE